VLESWGGGEGGLENNERSQMDVNMTALELDKKNRKRKRWGKKGAKGGDPRNEW